MTISLMLRQIGAVLFEGLAADWSAIVSLDGQWARNHVSFATSPIYLVTSLSAAPIRVENNANGLWGGPDNARIFAPINYNQFGSEMNSLVWTGSYQGGDDYAQGMDSGSPQVGESWSTGTEWIFNYRLYLVNGYRGNQQPASSVLPLYALSSELTVSAVPVPAAIWLFGSGLLGLVGMARRKKG